MIVKNEEAHLGHCLASVQGLVDEMVVVDTGSTDRTIEIAETFGAKLGHFKWVNDFAAARNESLRLCTGDWVLVLDADEAIDQRDFPVIRELIEKAESLAYYLPIRTYFLDGGQSSLDVAVTRNDSHYTEGKAYPYYAEAPGLRLFKRFDDLRFIGTVHELVNAYFESRGMAIGRTTAVLHHYGKLDTGREAFKKVLYLKLAEEDAQRDPANHQYQFNVMMQAMVAGEWEKTLSAAEAYIRLKGEAPYLVFIAAGMAHYMLGRPAEALHYYDQLLKAAPDHAMALTYRAQALGRLGRLVEARAALEKAIAINPSFMTPYVNLAELEGQAGTYEDARKALIRGITNNPDEERFYQAVVQLDLAHHKPEQAAADAWEAIQALPQGGGGEWHRLVAASLLKQGKPGPAQAIIAMGLKAFENHEGLTRLKALVEA
jgi:glycosyltransferase involved in cell wall biosynthesis